MLARPKPWRRRVVMKYTGYTLQAPKSKPKVQSRTLQAKSPGPEPKPQSRKLHVTSENQNSLPVIIILNFQHEQQIPVHQPFLFNSIFSCI
jgi:hypothetical protein